MPFMNRLSGGISWLMPSLNCYQGFSILCSFGSFVKYKL